MAAIEIIQEYLASALVPSGALFAGLGSRLPLLAVLAIISTLMPLVTQRKPLAGANEGGPADLLVQSCMSFGFLLVAIPAIEQIAPLLGCRNYSHWVALIVLILFMGAGNLSAATTPKASSKKLPNRLAVMASVLVLCLFALPPLFSRLSDLPEHYRIAGSVALVGFLGALLGNTWPSVLSLLKPRPFGQRAWFWGACGAISATASITAVSLFFAHGFTVTLFSGFAAYVLALGLAASQEAAS